jgi:hypothetical protein
MSNLSCIHINEEISSNYGKRPQNAGAVDHQLEKKLI